MIMQVPHDDPRERLRGAWGVRAKQALPAYTVLGVYAGQYVKMRVSGRRFHAKLMASEA
jgi:hypothetical protein